MEAFRDNLALTASYSLVGITVLIVGFIALDLVTPGKLRELVWVEHNRNAVILTTAMVIGQSIVLIGSLFATEFLVLWQALLHTLAYNGVAIAVMMWSFVLVDWLTPGRLGSLLFEDDEEHPASWITAAIFVGIGAVIGVALML